MAARRMQHAQRLAERARIVGRIVQRRVVHHQIELIGEQGQAVELGLKRHERSVVVDASAQAVANAGGDVDGRRAMTASGELVGEPAIPGAHIQHRQRAGQSALERSDHPRQKRIKGAGPDAPQVGLPAAQVPPGQRPVVGCAVRAPTFRAPDGLVFPNEPSKARRRGAGTARSRPAARRPSGSRRRWPIPATSSAARHAGQASAKWSPRSAGVAVSWLID